MSWTTVSGKSKALNKKKKENHKLSTQKVLDEMTTIFKTHTDSIKCVFLYGSTSRGTNTAMSDIDVLIIWKKNHISSLANKLKRELELHFSKKVDFVCMIYKNQIIYDFDNINTQDEFFIENVHRDAISIFGDKEDILFSTNIGKI